VYALKTEIGSFIAVLVPFNLLFPPFLFEPLFILS
jgi:hypothetical protein